MADPRLLAELAGRAEASGWDGFFLWDRIAYPPAGRAVADPWVALSAVAMATETLRLGPMVVPLARRRVQKVARETVTLDRLSNGRLTFGAGLGNPADFEPFGEVVDPRERARLLDENLERLDGYWRGEFSPPPVQRPRIPVWVGMKWPSRRPLRRAVRWDGVFPIDLPGPEQLAELVAEVAPARERGLFDVVVEVPPGADVGQWEAAGATWVLTSIDPQPPAHVVREVVEAGP